MNKKRYADIDKFKEQIQKAVDSYWLGFSNGYYLAEDVIEEINYNNFELADVEEVRHGKWIFNKLAGQEYYKCSCCGKDYPLPPAWNAYDINKYLKYCSACGAKMSEEAQYERL